MTDRELFAKTFKRGLLGGDSWKAWRAFLAALFGLPLSEEALGIFRKHTGRTNPPQGAFSEAYVIAGRRAGKSIISALVAVFLAAFRDYGGMLAPGEVGTLMVIAADRRQARVIFNYVTAFFEIPLLARLVANRTKESLMLTNRVTIEIHTCSFKATRGYTLIGVVADEVAFWRAEDSANPDTEVLNALRPGLATTGGLLLGISSPYSKRGALFNAFRDSYGKDDSPVLVWKARSREMNPSLSPAVVALAYARDAAAARAEFGGEFRDDLEGFLPLEVVEGRVVRNRRELPPIEGINYVGFVDPSGGQADSMALAIAHFEKQRVVLDLLRERQAPFSPEDAAAEFAQELRRYRIYTVVGDRYSGAWVREAFSKRGVEYRPSERSRPEIYLEVLPVFMSGQIELLDNRKLVAQLVNLERRTARQGRDSVDHPVGAHDDVANAAAGALVLAATEAAGGMGLVEFLKQLHAGKHKEVLFDSCNAPGANSSPTYGGEDRDHPCVKCRQVPVKRIDVNTYECPECGIRFTVGAFQMPTGIPGRSAEVLAAIEPSPERPGQGWRSFVDRGVFGRFGKR